MTQTSELVVDTLPGPGQAGSLLEQAKAHPEHSIILDASGIEEVTAANLQVLLCLRAMKSGQEDGFKVQNPSDAFRESLALLGVDTDFFESEPHS